MAYLIFNAPYLIVNGEKTKINVDRQTMKERQHYGMRFPLHIRDIYI